MLAIEARKMGYRVAIFSPDSFSPAGQIADKEISSAYEDSNAVENFAKGVDVITFEFENVPSGTVEAASQFAPIHPRGDILHTTQNRLREKIFLANNGFPVTPFRKVRTIEELYGGVKELGLPCIIKTAGFGYDGKGQIKINADSNIEIAFEKIGDGESILEAFVKFKKEISVIGTRSAKGNFVDYGVIENDHKNHILDVSFAPGNVSNKVKTEALEIARGIAEEFKYVGTFCVEFFIVEDEKLLVNEIAPRPHNSGHLTFDSVCATSQFEQQLRAICGLPLGSTEFLKPVAMSNLLGDLWQHGEPNWNEALKKSNVKLHLYGKREARLGRKMGHLIAFSNTSQTAVNLVLKARERLLR